MGQQFGILLYQEHLVPWQLCFFPPVTQVTQEHIPMHRGRRQPGKGPPQPPLKARCRQEHQDLILCRVHPARLTRFKSKRFLVMSHEGFQDQPNSSGTETQKIPHLQGTHLLRDSSGGLSVQEEGSSLLPRGHVALGLCSRNKRSSCAVHCISSISSLPRRFDSPHFHINSKGHMHIAQ